MISILHISPHLGGGVGRVLLNLLEKNKNHGQIIYCLDTINDSAKNHLTINNIEFYERMHADIKKLIEAIKHADIVVIHWWNHPLLYDFIVRYTLPACRLIFWSHVSGKEVPQIFSEVLFKYPDYFVFTTPISFLTNEVKKFNNPEKFDVVWATGGLEYVKNVKKKEHFGFNIGYIGTVDFSKMHPNFISMCSKIDIPDVKFIVCGEGKIDLLKKQAEELGIAHKFEFTGFINDITQYLEIFDIFGYPLNKTHYGTCDQVLSEAMACGIVPIVFNNDMEKYMIQDEENGIIVNSENEYIQTIMNLYHKKEIRKKLEKEAKKKALQTYCIDYTIQQWENIYKKIILKPKSIKCWNGKYSGAEIKPHQVFIESIGEYGDIFMHGNEKEITKLICNSEGFKSDTKGSIKHYNNFFKDDILMKWSNI